MMAPATFGGVGRVAGAAVLKDPLGGSMKKLLMALFLGLFVAAGSPMVLHADDMAAGAGEVKETPKKEKKHKKAKRHKKHKKAAEAAKDSAAPAEGAAK
jgi:Ni/Co efflux regulator RcnB